VAVAKRALRDIAETKGAALEAHWHVGFTGSREDNARRVMTAAAPEVVLVNGAPAQTVSALDRALHYGDGLFETIACCRGVPRFLSLHLNRLVRGCERLGLEAPDLAAVKAEVRQLAQGRDRAIIKVLLTRGTALARGYSTSGGERATRITICYTWPDADAASLQDGVRVRTAALKLGENPVLAGVKHLNRLEQVLARREWTDPAIAEALLYSRSGMLVSGTMSNVFMVQGSCLRTPRIDLCGVAGVMRHVVLDEARRSGIRCEERELRTDDVAAADELFLTNARIGIWPIAALDGRALAAPGPVTRQLKERLAPRLEEPTDG
jgi:4-amino-4-deoxychorismate lyase